MWMFPIWFVKAIVLGGLVLCAFGVAVLVLFLLSDSRKKRIW